MVHDDAFDDGGGRGYHDVQSADDRGVVRRDQFHDGDLLDVGELARAVAGTAAAGSRLNEDEVTGGTAGEP